MSDEIVIWCHTREDYDALMGIFETHGIRWRGGEEPSGYNGFFDGEECAYELDLNRKTFGVGSLGYFRRENRDVIEFHGDPIEPEELEESEEIKNFLDGYSIT